MTYTVVRSHRRTLGLQLSPSGELVVRAPLRTSTEHIERVIRAHARWIERSRARLQGRPQPRVHTFAPGSTLPYLGREFILRYSSNSGLPVALSDVFKVDTANAIQAKKYLEQWYRRMALHYYTVRLQEIAEKHHITLKQIHLSSARTRWGSCSGRGVISVVWRLIFAPPAVIDYVLCHELAHVIHHNHGPHFWQLVAQLQPDFETHRQWLRTHGHTLHW